MTKKKWISEEELELDHLYSSMHWSMNKLAKKPLDKTFLNLNNVIWGTSVTVIPLLGLTLLMSMGLILGLLLIEM